MKYSQRFARKVVGGTTALFIIAAIHATIPADLTHAQSVGALRLSPARSSVCSIPDLYIPGQRIRIRGEGFLHDGTVEVYVRALFGLYRLELDPLPVDGEGVLDAVIRLPWLLPPLPFTPALITVFDEQRLLQDVLVLAPPHCLGLLRRLTSEEGERGTQH